jgi:peptidoglycan/LPS O-acetylase OafA/YrhL
VIIGLIVALSLVASTIIIHLLMVLLVGCCVIRENNPIAPALSLKWVSYIGTISYGMYMLHMLCLNAVNKGLGFIGWNDGGYQVFILTALVSTLVAGLSFKYYESYFLKLKDKFSSQKRPTIIAVAQPVVATVAVPVKADKDPA